MRAYNILKATCLLVLATSLLTVTAAESSRVDYTGLREWTSTKGDKIKATYFNAMYGNVYLKKEKKK